jgi:hypothetical protein
MAIGSVDLDVAFLPGDFFAEEFLAVDFFASSFFAFRVAMMPGGSDGEPSLIRRIFGV